MSLPIINGTRWQLVPTQLDDLETLWRHWTRPKVREFLWDDLEISIERAREVVDGCIRSADEFGLGLWCLRLLEPSDFAGFVALRHVFEEPLVELLYGLEPKYWGRGLATEAAESVLRYGFETLGLDKIVAGFDPPNQRSAMVIRRLGMTPLDPPKQTNAIYRQLLRDDRAREVSLAGNQVGNLLKPAEVEDSPEPDQNCLSCVMTK